MQNFLSNAKSKWSEYERNICILNDPTVTGKSAIEQIVAQNLDDYIENEGENLMRLNIQILYNIFSKKIKKFTKHDRAYELINQNFLENHDSNIFILLKFIEGSKIEIHKFNDSIVNSEQRYGFRPIFDFSIFDDIKMLKEQNQRKDEVIQQLKKNCEEQKEEIQKLKKNIEQLNDAFRNENINMRALIQEIKLKNDNLHDELRKQNENHQNQLKSIENKITSNEQISNNFYEQINEMKNHVKEEFEKNEKYQKELTQKQESYEKLIDDQNKKTKELGQSILKIKNDTENLLKEHSNKILEIQKSQKSLVTLLDDLNLEQCPNGFFKYLFDKYNFNPIAKGLIGITGNCDESNKSFHIMSIIDSNYSCYYNSEDEPNSYIKIDFKNYLIKIDKYTLFLGDDSNSRIINSWILKGTTKENKEIILDEVNNSNEVTEKNPKITRNIPIQNIHLVNSIYLQMIGENSRNTKKLVLRNIEFFGSFKSKS